MDSVNSTAEGVNNTAVTDMVVLSKKSWTAYAILAINTILILSVISIVSAIFNGRLIATLPFLALVLIRAIYLLLMIRSVVLYHDDNGVWIYSGVLPWNKGVSGVKWRDIDEALVAQSLWSWMFRSYPIILKQRFTKATEIRLSHMNHGDIAVGTINELLFSKFPVER